MNLISKLSNPSKKGLIGKVNRFIGERKFRAHSHPKVFNWEWNKKGFNRIAAVNHIISIS